MVTDYTEVTEIAGTEISAEQLERMSHRYHWAAAICRNKDVLEVGCGSGQGLGLLMREARSVSAGDYSERVLSVPRAHYGNRLELREFDAQALPFADRSKDVIILFEAIYYVSDAKTFVEECRRVLRPGGVVLVATANKDLPDFNPSPMSYEYFGAVELRDLFSAAGFAVSVFGYLRTDEVSWRQRILKPAKRFAVAVGLMPKTMRGKVLLKRLVFGRLVEMPAELPLRDSPLEQPTPIAEGERDVSHKVLYCSATLPV